MMTDYEYIIRNIGKDDLVTQLAEEAVELSQAALKLRRAAGRGTPTDVEYSDAYDHLLEEIADVINCLAYVLRIGISMTPNRITCEDDVFYIDRIRKEKTKRFADRIRKAGGEDA